MKNVPFQPAHLDLLVLREHEERCVEVRQFLQTITVGTVTLVDDGRVIAIMGMYLLWTGVLEVFVLPSVYVGLRPVGYCLFVRKILDRLIKADPTLHRVQTRSLDDEQTNRWMEMLGFTCEGNMEAYTSNKDNYKMWARKVNDGVR